MWEKENKVRQYILPIGYTVVMTLCVPLHMMLLECALLAGSGNAESSSWLGLGLYGAGVLIYLMAVAVLGILNVVRSFRAYRQKDIRYCVNGMLILKYGMVLYFIINYVVIAMIVLAGGLAAFVGSRGTILFARPFMLPGILFFMTVLVIGTWLIMVPGAFYGVQVIRLSYGEKKMGMGAALLHGFLQFNFLVDVLDAMYLAVKKWGMGKKSSVLIGILYGGAGAGLIWFIAGAVN